MTVADFSLSTVYGLHTLGRIAPRTAYPAYHRRVLGLILKIECLVAA